MVWCVFVCILLWNGMTHTRPIGVLHQIKSFKLLCLPGCHLINRYGMVCVCVCVFYYEMVWLIHVPLVYCTKLNHSSCFACLLFFVLFLVCPCSVCVWGLCVCVHVCAMCVRACANVCVCVCVHALTLQLRTEGGGGGGGGGGDYKSSIHFLLFSSVKSMHHTQVLLNDKNKTRKFYISSLFLFFLFFYFVFNVLYQFLCNLQQYCNSAYNKLNSLQQKEFINNKNELYLEKEKKIEEREGDKHMHSRLHARTNTRTPARTHARTHSRTHTHARTHARTHAHTHKFQTKIQAIKRPNKQINDKPNKIVLT